MRIATALQQCWFAQAGHLFPWAAVCFGIGVGVFFAWPMEPGLWEWCGAAVLAVAGVCLRRSARALGWVLILCAAGFGSASLRAHQVAPAVLGFRYYGPVEGRLVATDRSQSDALRLTLDQVYLSRVSAEDTPRRVRIAVRDLEHAPLIGSRVMTTAHLAPAGGPVEPGGFDFRRHLWFMGIGAVGYTRVPVVLAARPDTDLPVARFRAEVTRALHQRLPGAGGAVAAAVLTGDRSGLTAETTEDLRISNLAHLLAISGLHMGLLSGVVFTAIRFVLVAGGVLWGRDLRAKKAAAAVALGASAAYLMLSGGNVATERAFVMVAVVLSAVLLGRRALTLRSVALAALVILAHRPESLLSPGFQMSFAATTGLVAAFAVLRERRVALGPRWARPVLTLLLSSAVAGLATAPFGAAHFNTVSHYGLLANLLAVPVMGMVVMPAAVAAVVLIPLGAEGIALWAMVQGLEWILGVARFISELPEPRSFVPQADTLSLILISLGGMVLCLVRGPIRMGGAVLMAVAFAHWTSTDRPYLLVAEDGGLMGVMTQAGRALSHERGNGFAARVWLENDGTPMAQAEAAKRWRDEPYAVLKGKRAAAAFEGCNGYRLVVSNQPLADGTDRSCILLDPKILRQTGSLSISRTGEITTTRSKTGLRLWSPDEWYRSGDPLDGHMISVGMGDGAAASAVADQ